MHRYIFSLVIFVFSFWSIKNFAKGIHFATAWVIDVFWIHQKIQQGIKWFELNA